MMISKLQSLGVVGGFLGGLVLGTAFVAVFSAVPPARAQGQTPAAPKPKDANKALAAEQLKLARQAIVETEAMYKNARLDNLDRVAIWERRQVEALKASGVGKEELVSALEAYVKRMKNLAALAEARYQRASASHADVLEGQYQVLEAEMWLNQEKSR